MISIKCKICDYRGKDRYFNEGLICTSADDVVEHMFDRHPVQAAEMQQCIRASEINPDNNIDQIPHTERRIYPDQFGHIADLVVPLDRIIY